MSGKVRSPKEKIFTDPNMLLPILEKRKQEGAVVVFGNGCFELIHVGHVRYISAAKELGDILIIAVNTDESMKKIKPDRRPVNPDYERFEIIASLESVDYVVPLSDTNPISLLHLFRPHIHTKGTDYTLDKIPERSVVENYGGRVVLVGDPKEHSTTRMLSDLRKP